MGQRKQILNAHLIFLVAFFSGVRAVSDSYNVSRDSGDASTNGEFDASAHIMKCHFAQVIGSGI